MVSIVLTESQKRALHGLVNSRKAPAEWVLRGRAILLCATDVSLASVGRDLNRSPKWVRKWCRRWQDDPRVESLRDAARSGRPVRYEVALCLEVVAMACDRPKESLFRDVWSQQALADAVNRTHQTSMSRSTIGRILRSRELRPHLVRHWLHSPDPDFQAKTKAICELYLHPPSNALVVSIDEKPLQCLERKHRTRRQSNAVVRKEFEYKRHGTACLLAAFDTQTGRVFGQVVDHRDGPTTVAFIRKLARKHPDRPIHIVWDNLNTHGDGPSKRWTQLNSELGQRLHFTFTPLHASWVNQVEIWFSILQKRLIRNSSFANRTAMKRAILAFIKHWNRYEAKPFRWRFTGDFVQPTRALC